MIYLPQRYKENGVKSISIHYLLYLSYIKVLPLTFDNITKNEVPVCISNAKNLYFPLC